MNNLDSTNATPLPILSLKGVSKLYVSHGMVTSKVSEAMHIFRHLDFDVHAKDWISIRGASGIGKSTLLHILGLLDKPNAGIVLFEGQDVANMSDNQISKIRNRDMGFVFQFHHLLPDFTGWENVLMPLRIGKALNKEAQDFAMSLVQRVGMEHRLGHLPSEMSGGERQRLALVRALVSRPKVLLADEPSGNLDEHNSNELHSLLLEIQEELGMAIVLVTHDGHLSSLAKKQYVMTEGLLELVEEVP
jgi:lipoprotein-releasing system ATP-binding protein